MDTKSGTQIYPNKRLAAKRIVAFFVAAALVLTMFPTTFAGGKVNEAQAATHTNISFATAQTIGFNANVSSVFDDDGSKNFFKFTLTATSALGIAEMSKSGFTSIYYSIYDVNQNVVKDYPEPGTVFYLNSGTYYLQIQGYRSSGISQAALIFALAQESAAESFGEQIGGNNNSIATANAIKVNTQYTGVLAVGKSDPTDYYKFTLAYDSQVTMNSATTSGLGTTEPVTFYKSSGAKVSDIYGVYLGTNKIVTLNKGTYYVQIGEPSYNKYNGGGKYTLKLSVKPKVVTLKKPSGKRGKVTVKWAKVKGATSYKIYRAVTKSYTGGKYKLLKTVKGGSKVKYVDKKATKKRTYYKYKVVAYVGKVKGATADPSGNVSYAYVRFY